MNSHCLKKLAWLSIWMVTVKFFLRTASGHCTIWRFFLVKHLILISILIDRVFSSHFLSPVFIFELPFYGCILYRHYLMLQYHVIVAGIHWLFSCFFSCCLGNKVSYIGLTDVYIIFFINLWNKPILSRRFQSIQSIVNFRNSLPLIVHLFIVHLSSNWYISTVDTLKSNFRSI